MSLLRELVLNNWHLKLLALLISFLLWSTYTAEPSAEMGYVVPLEFRDVPEPLEISGEVPTQVHVRLRGRPALLRRLTPGDLTISVRLGGLPEGEARIPLRPGLVETPFGAEVAAISPSEIRVRLAPRPATF